MVETALTITGVVVVAGLIIAIVMEVYESDQMSRGANAAASHLGTTA